MLLELKSISKSFESPVGGEEATVVLKEVSFRLDRGETLSIVGPSGSGKSTLLNIVGALDRPTSGEVLFDGKNLAACGETELACSRPDDGARVPVRPPGPKHSRFSLSKREVPGLTSAYKILRLIPFAPMKDRV